jgi:hypothetical protein
MNETILAKLHTALYEVAPLTSDREDLIAEMGHTILLETFTKALMLVSEERRPLIVEALNVEDREKAFDLFLEEEVPLEDLLQETADEVLREVLEEKS